MIYTNMNVIIFLIIALSTAVAIPRIPYEEPEEGLHPNLMYDIPTTESNNIFKSLGNFFKTTILSGFDFVNNAVPQIEPVTTEDVRFEIESGTTPKIEVFLVEDEDDSKNVSRARRQEVEDLLVGSNIRNEELVKNITVLIEALSEPHTNRTDTIQSLSKSLGVLANKVVRNTTTSELVIKIIERLKELENSAREVDAVFERLRDVRQEGSFNDIDSDVEQISPVGTTTKPQEVTARQESESSEEDGNLIANLLSSFLGGLSKPDGGVDVDAIVGLVGGLSVQKDDGTYDFSGLTDLLQSFLGGDGQGGGGSDVGSFLGGLLGAILQGSANPPGPKGTGRFTGNLVANIIPGLSGPPPSSSEDEKDQQQGGLDSGSFLAGLLTSMLGASSGTSSKGVSGSGKPPANGGRKTAVNSPSHNDCCKGGSASFLIMVKNSIVKTVLSLVSSILASSSSSSSHSSQGKH